MKQHEIYQTITDTIIKLLEQHKQEWDRPWITFGQSGDMLSFNSFNGENSRIRPIIGEESCLFAIYIQNSKKE